MVLTLEDLKCAQRSLAGVAVRTPLVRCVCSGVSPCPCSGTDLKLHLIHLKFESLQPMGAFKLRGAYNKISSLNEEQRAAGIVAYSSGNHAQGVAYAARELGIRATIVLPEDAPEVKVERTKGFAAEIVFAGTSSDERKAEAERLARENGYAIVVPYDDEILMAGQGTVGLEILEDMPDVETVLVPVGGGGLVGGIASALKLQRPDIRVIGVEPELASDAQASVRGGRLVSFPPEQTSRTIADALRSQQLGAAPWAHIREFVDDIITVSEEEIKEGMRRLAFGSRLVAEPGGIVAYAAYLFRQAELPQTYRNAVVIPVVC